MLSVLTVAVPGRCRSPGMWPMADGGVRLCESQMSCSGQSNGRTGSQETRTTKQLQLSHCKQLHVISLDGGPGGRATVADPRTMRRADGGARHDSLATLPLRRTREGKACPGRKYSCVYGRWPIAAVGCCIELVVSDHVARPQIQVLVLLVLPHGGMMTIGSCPLHTAIVF